MSILCRRAARDCPKFAGLWRQQTQAGYVRIRLASTLSEFQSRKILGEFDTLYDRNKDGFVDKKDIENYRKELSDYYAATRGKMSRMADHGFDDFWILFKDLADANKDGLLSREEWLDMWTSIHENAADKSFTSLPQWVRLLPGAIFPIMDVKEDGVLDAEEYKNFWFRIGGLESDDKQVQEVIDTMTENGKHELNLKRFETLYADFYLSSDKTSPGRYMAGPIEYD